MNKVRQEFADRLREIDAYIAFLKEAEKGSENLVIPTTKKVDTALLEQVLKANTHIVLYNLLESTVNNILEAIFAHLYAHETVNKLSSDLRQLWIESSLGKKRGENLYAEVNNLVVTFVKAEKQKIDKSVLRVSGNLDAKAIRELFARIGICCSGKQLNLESLKNIKDARNYLAHGEKSFADIGKTMTFKDIHSLRKDVGGFLKQLIDLTDNYIQRKAYLVAHVKSKK